MANRRLIALVARYFPLLSELDDICNCRALHFAGRAVREAASYGEVYRLVLDVSPG